MRGNIICPKRAHEHTETKAKIKALAAVLKKNSGFKPACLFFTPVFVSALQSARGSSPPLFQTHH